MTSHSEETRLRVAIQGEAGCFHDAAAREFFSPRGCEIDIVECETFADLAEAMTADASLLGIMAIENTIAGSMLPNHELIRRTNARVVGEHKMRISHALCALPGQTIGDIHEVNSHPIALMQCEQFLRRYPAMSMVEKNDTAGSAREIAARRLTGHAAVCSAYAARLYGLDVLADGIETNKHNFTRFLILADPLVARDIAPASTEVDKASLVFSLPHTQGALSKVLTILSFYDINLTKIQSTPIVGREWEYRFYVDVSFADPVRYHQAITAITPLLNDFHELGLYREAPTPPVYNPSSKNPVK